MSAIAGVVYFDRKADPAADCRRMLKELSVYARDGDHLWGDAVAALGLCKMRIVPEDSFDAQPLTDAASGLVLVADVRLDNREELRAELGIDPAAALAMADADFILAAFKRWGEDCARRLLGDFAFAVYDARRRSLFCARDQVGMRPLFYHADGDWIAFASMPSGLLALPGISKALDEDSLIRHLALLPRVASSSFFRDIARLPAAHGLSASRAGMRQRCYWQTADIRPIRFPSDQDYVEAFRQIFDEAVRCRLRRVGPIGAQLSGGLDSSSVTVTAARILAESGHTITAFTSVPRKGFDGKVSPANLADEGPHAAAAAALYPNIEHVLIHNDRRSFMDYLERDQGRLGAPIRNPTNIGWLSAINEEAHRRGIRLILSGGCGNVTLSYDGMESLSGMFRSGRWLALLAELRALAVVEKKGVRALASLAVGPSMPLWLRRLDRRFRGFEPWRYSPINPELIGKLGLKPLFDALYAREYSRPMLNSLASRTFMLLTTDFGTYTFGLTCTWGLDQRDPTADKRVVEFCLAIPDRQFLHRGIRRRLVRRAMSGTLPAETLDERLRGLQAADWHEDMTASKARIAAEICAAEHSEMARRLIDFGRLHTLLRNWPNQHWDSGEIYTDYCLALTRGLAVGNFIRCAETS